MTLPEQITRADVESAPMFTIFDVEPPVIIPTRFRMWDVFNEGEELFSTEVEMHLEGQGIRVNGHIERDDELVRHLQEFIVQEPFKVDDLMYDDVDASLEAIAAGMKLIKVPDKMHSKCWRMYVVEDNDG